jgi:hypothetical protein
MVNIIEGRYYKTRDGRKVGPMFPTGDFDDKWTARSTGIDLPHWHDNGSHYSGSIRDTDLIAEWQDGPVVTETVKRIVPGVYGALGVGTVENGTVRVGFERMASVYLPLTAPELRAAAAVLTQLADALEDK